MDAGEKVCPDCAETVKAGAKVCKHCGYRFRSAKLSKLEVKTNGQRKPATSGCGFVSVVIGALLLVALWSESRSPTGSQEIQGAAATDESPFSDTSKQSLWIVMSQDAIKERLRDPDSADFRNTRFYSGGKVPVVCGEVNAKNAFGGFTGFERFIASGDNTEIAFLESDLAAGESLDEAWNAFCVTHERDEAYVP